MLPRTQRTNGPHPLSMDMARLSALLSLRGGCSGHFLIQFGFVLSVEVCTGQHLLLSVMLR